MALEERYLWICEYQLHEVDRLWWAYFQDQEEVDGFFRHVGEILPCLILNKLEERPTGLVMGTEYLHARFTAQMRAREIKQSWKFVEVSRFPPPAPAACDLLTAFVRDLENFQPCSACTNFAPLVASALPANAKPRRKKCG